MLPITSCLGVAHAIQQTLEKLWICNRALLIFNKMYISFSGRQIKAWKFYPKSASTQVWDWSVLHRLYKERHLTMIQTCLYQSLIKSTRWVRLYLLEKKQDVIVNDDDLKKWTPLVTGFGLPTRHRHLNSLMHRLDIFESLVVKEFCWICCQAPGYPLPSVVLQKNFFQHWPQTKPLPIFVYFPTN